MSRHLEEHLDLCAGYVLDALEPFERRRLEDHLAEGCPVCREEIARLSEGLPLLAASAGFAAPPAALRRRVLAAVAEEKRARVRSIADGASAGPSPFARPGRHGLYVAWSAAAALAVIAGLQWFGRQGLDTQVRSLRGQMARLEHRATRSEQALATEREWAVLASSPRARVVDFVLTPQGIHALQARVVYDPASGRAMISFENSRPPAGSDYELWAIRPQGPQALGLVRADAGGHAEIRVPNAGAAANLGAFAVSLEKTGGSPNPHAPAGPVVLVAKLPS